MRLPGAWDGFEVAVHRMVRRRHVGDPAAAATVVARLARALGRPLAPRPRARPGPSLSGARGARPVGAARARPVARGEPASLRRLAEGVAAGAIQFQSATFDDLVGQLTREAGFDAPTANWIAMRSLGEPDAAPFDLPSSPARVSRELAREPDRERWRPWRSYVAVCQASAGRAGLDVRGARAARMSRPRGRAQARLAPGVAMSAAQSTDCWYAAAAWISVSSRK